MPAFPKPKFTVPFALEDELQALRQHKIKRKIPERSDDHLLIATWNISNLGLQDRWEDHYQMLAEIIGWFDVVAVQEVNDNLSGLKKLEGVLPDYYDWIFSDRAGNNERSAFVFDSRKVSLREEVGEISLTPRELSYIHLPGVDQPFLGFDRNPYLATFEYNNFVFVLISLHVFFGSDKKEDVDRRCLETYALARYADLRRKSVYAYSKNIIALGDYNLPKVEKGDPVYDALTKRGLHLPEHSTKVYSNISNDKQYDQIAFFPGLKSRITNQGVFDFDGAVFGELWEESPAKFRNYLKYYLSDHRPMWVELSV